MAEKIDVKELNGYGESLAADGYDILQNGSAETSVGLRLLDDGIDIVSKLAEVTIKADKNSLEEKKLDLDSKKFEFSKDIEKKKFESDKESQEKRIGLEKERLEFEKKLKLEFEKDLQDKKLGLEEKKLELEKDIQEKRLEFEKSKSTDEKDIQNKRIELEDKKIILEEKKLEIESKKIELEEKKLKLEKDIQADKINESKENRNSEFKKAIVVGIITGTVTLVGGIATTVIAKKLEIGSTERKFAFAKELFNGIFESEQEGCLPFSGTNGRLLEKVVEKTIL